MRNSYTLWSEEAQPALILLIEDATVSPWDSSLARLVNDLEDRLDSVPVNLAGSSRSLPDLREAIWAAQFVGAPAAVVVADREGSPHVFGKQPILQGVALPAVVTTAHWNPEAIAIAYRQAQLKVADREAVAAGG